MSAPEQFCFNDPQTGTLIWEAAPSAPVDQTGVSEALVAYNDPVTGELYFEPVAQPQEGRIQ